MGLNLYLFNCFQEGRKMNWDQYLQIFCNRSYRGKKFKIKSSNTGCHLVPLSMINMLFLHAKDKANVFNL